VAAPTLVLGTPNAGTTGATSYTQASHATDDILGLATETNVTGGLSDPTAPTGCVNVDNSPRPQGSNVTTITAWWKRATSGAEADFSVPATANHQVGIPFRIRGGLTTGDPWDVAAADGQATGTTGRAFDVSGGNTLTTLTADSLVVYLIACHRDTDDDTFAGAITTAPTGLTSWTVHDQHFTSDGNGGGILVASGVRATPGVVGPLNWDFTVTGAWSGIALAFPPASGVTNLDGDAALTGTGTNTGSGVVGAIAAAALAATVALTGAGVVGASGGATLVGTGTISATATVGTTGVSGSAALAGTGAITGAAAVGTVASATLPGTGSLSASATRGTVATAALAGTDTISGTGAVGVASGATLAGTGTLSAAATVTAGGTVSGTLAGTGALAGNGVVGRLASSSLTGTGTLSAAAVRGVTSTASLTGTGTLAASGQVGANAQAALAGAGSINAAGTLGLNPTATLAGTAVISGTAQVAISTTATLAGVGTISAAGDAEDPSAFRDITATATLTRTRSATLTRHDYAATTARRPLSATIGDRPGATLTRRWTARLE